MARILFFLLLGLAAYLAYRWWRAKLQAPPTPDGRLESEPMVRCEHCGVNLPASDAVALGERRFCSAEHKRLAAGE